jgi:hypothetical protein
MSEARYTSSTNDLLPPEVYVLKISLKYVAGVPDCYYSGAGGDHWAEWKLLKSIPRVLDLTAGKKPKLSKLQQAWLIGRHNEGRSVSVIVGSPVGAVIFPGLSWQLPIAKSDFIARARTKRETAAEISKICLRN